jgi:hypothetical protein
MVPCHWLQTLETEAMKMPKDMKKFLKDARHHKSKPGVALHVQLILQTDSPGLIAAAFSGDVTAERLVLIIDRWLKITAAAPPGNRSLCINDDCAVEFSGTQMPVAFMITQAFNDKAKQMVVGGLCEACFTRVTSADELDDLALKMWRKILPDAQISTGRHQ